MEGHALGIVVDFNAARGLGTVELYDGARLSFHATSLNDRSRSVDVGAPVSVVVRATHRGEVHAVDVVKAVR